MDLEMCICFVMGRLVGGLEEVDTPEISCDLINNNNLKT